MQVYTGCVNHTFVCLGLICFHDILAKCLKCDSSRVIICVLVSTDGTCQSLETLVRGNGSEGKQTDRS